MNSIARRAPGRRIGLRQEQQIDVAEGGQVAAPVAAGRDHSHPAGRGGPYRRRGIIHQRRDDAIHMGGKGRGGSEAGQLIPLEGVLQLMLHPGQVPAEGRERRVTRHRAVHPQLRQGIGHGRAEGCGMVRHYHDAKESAAGEPETKSFR